jgi:predicted enzyme related to lactoylglutathione lyase
MAKLHGEAAAGMMQLSADMAESGMPPVWTTYVSVDDIDAAVAKVEPAGGSVMQSPMDAMEAGRFAVIADPAGAVICLWQAKEHIGCQVVNEHGAFCWAELITPDPAAVTPFYAEVFGWTAQTTPMPPGSYTVFSVAGGNENGIAGAMAPPIDGMATFWSAYIMVDDAAATVDVAKAHGGQALMEATETPGVGTWATLADPHGAVFSIMQPTS